MMPSSLPASFLACGRSHCPDSTIGDDRSEKAPGWFAHGTALKLHRAPNRQRIRLGAHASTPATVWKQIKNTGPKAYRAFLLAATNRSLLALAAIITSTILPVSAAPAQHGQEQQAQSILKALQGRYLSSEGSRMYLHFNARFQPARIIGSVANFSTNGAPEHIEFTLDSINQNIHGTWSAGLLVERNVSGPALFGDGIIQLTSTDMGLWQYVLCPEGPSGADLTFIGGDGWWGKFLDARAEATPAGRSVLARMRIRNAGGPRRLHVSMFGGRLTLSSGTADATSFYDASTGRDDAAGPLMSTCGEEVITWRFANVKDAVTAFSPVVRNRAAKAIPITVAADPGTDTPAPTLPQTPAPTPPATPQPAPPTEPLPRPAPSQPVPTPKPPAQPAPATGSPSGPIAGPGFKPLRKFDVRVDRVVSARDAQRIDVFMTVRNASAQPQYIPSGTLQVILEDSEGVAKQNGQVLRPTEAGREHFASTPVVAPGRELRIKYSFHPDSGASPSRVTIMEGDKSDFSASF